MGHANKKIHATQMLALIFAVLTSAVVAALLRPLVRKEVIPQPAGTELERAVYRDQLAELERDASRGLIGSDEADAARNEIARRMLLTVAAGKPDTAQSISKLSLLAVLIVPLVAIPLYAYLGNPRLPDVPLAQRMQLAVENQDMPAMIRQVERQLEKKPDDLRGWQTLAPVYSAERRWNDAANAYGNIIRLTKPTSALMMQYAEMLMMANGGEINSGAQAALRQALQLDPHNAQARFFDALAYKQQGKLEEARTRLEALLADTPVDAPYRQTVETELKDLAGAKAPALSNEQLAAANTMSGQDKAAMIASMIDGLEKRLGSTSTDLEGWLRLIRARSVNGEPDKARQSLATARGIFSQNKEAIASLASLAGELGLDR